MNEAALTETIPPTRPAHGVSFREAFWVWVRVAALSFGGPAGQIAVMHRLLVEEKRWIGETRFLHALNYCMLLPGPEAHQLAIYIGWLLHRTRGGIIAGTLFVLPGLKVEPWLRSPHSPLLLSSSLACHSRSSLRRLR
jgi:chromate transporter